LVFNLAARISDRRTDKETDKPVRLFMRPISSLGRLHSKSQINMTFYGVAEA